MPPNAAIGKRLATFQHAFEKNPEYLCSASLAVVLPRNSGRSLEDVSQEHVPPFRYAPFMCVDAG